MTAPVAYPLDIHFALPPPRELARAAGGCTLHVLILDDEPTIVEILREVLADEGCRVTGFTEPPSIDEIARLAPDVIILDLVFGGRNCGLGFLTMLRSHPATAAIPVVVCTALTDSAITSALAQLRWEVQVLTKPFDIDAVGCIVRSAVGSSATCLPA